MTVDELLRERGPRLTVDDLDRLPEDGTRYELVDGVLIMSPAPTNVHEIVTDNLADLLKAADRRPRQYRVFQGIGLRPDSSNAFIPDVTVVSIDEIADRYQEVPPALAVEVASPSTAGFDRNIKKDRYERFGIPHYWIIDPRKEQPSLTVFELFEGVYKQVAYVTGQEAFTTRHPLPVRVIPAQLLELDPEF